MSAPGVEWVFVDSNCLTFVVDAVWGVARPTVEPVEEKIALFRSYVYAVSTLWAGPTVEHEFERMKDEEKKVRHRAATNSLFGIRRPDDIEAAARRAQTLSQYHDDPDDCLVVAEAEGAFGEVLLTFDGDLIKRLGQHSRIPIMRPTEFWEALAIPRGAQPRTVPRFDNPLAAQGWWRW